MGWFDMSQTCLTPLAYMLAPLAYMLDNHWHTRLSRRSEHHPVGYLPTSDMKGVRSMVYGRFAAYVNIPTEQVTLHSPPCLQMGKHVGVRRTDNGYYRVNYRSAESVKRLADRLGYELVVCSFCLKGFDVDAGRFLPTFVPNPGPPRS